MQLTLIEGNEAIARAAVKAGCRFFAGYPITPATTIFSAMLKLLPPMGGICLQGEDEIASMGLCIGASMAGMKTMTATSGPGISLCSEQISFAIGSEIPVVIVDVQRLGPSTGSATKGADGDIQFLRWGQSSGLPSVVLAPVDIKDCFELTVQAFNLSETYRCPVFLAANKEIAMTRESIDMETLVWPRVRSRPSADANQDFLPFHVSEKNRVPPFLPIGGRQLVRQTSSTHGPDGYITMDPAVIAANQDRLLHKLSSAVAEFSFFDFFQGPETDTIVVTYGVTSRAAKAAAETLRLQDGPTADLLVLKTLWPAPEQLILEKTEKYTRVVVVEMNLGLYVLEIQRLLPQKQVDFFGQMNGELITPGQIMELIRHG
jgi:2-oxoglutarate ferredoxin oxidoreductase subunit alpha